MGMFSKIGWTNPLGLNSLTGRDAMKAAKKEEKKTQALLAKQKKELELKTMETDSEIARRKLLGAQGAYGNKSLLSRMSLNTSSQKLGG